MPPRPATPPPMPGKKGSLFCVARQSRDHGISQRLYDEPILECLGFKRIASMQPEGSVRTDAFGVLGKCGPRTRIAEDILPQVSLGDSECQRSTVTRQIESIGRSGRFLLAHLGKDSSAAES
jgi:hypothetical protein